MADGKIQDEERELTQILRSITPEGRRELMVFARGIAATYPKVIDFQKAQRRHKLSSYLK